MVAERGHPAGLAALLDLRTVPRPPVTQHLTSVAGAGAPSVPGRPGASSVRGKAPASRTPAPDQAPATRAPAPGNRPGRAAARALAQVLDCHVAGPDEEFPVVEGN